MFLSQVVLCIVSSCCCLLYRRCWFEVFPPARTRIACPSDVGRALCAKAWGEICTGAARSEGEGEGGLWETHQTTRKRSA